MQASKSGERQLGAKIKVLTRMEARRAARVYKSRFKVPWWSDEMVAQLRVIGLEFLAEKVERFSSAGGFHGQLRSELEHFLPGPRPEALSLP
jgi:hypothetical protein